MNKHYKVYLIFSIIIITIFGAKLYKENIEGQRIANLSMKYEAKSIADFLMAFRTTYQNIFIKNHIQLNEDNIDFLPVRTTSEIAKIFSSLNAQAIISTISQRPRNIKNLANKRQLEAIKYFAKNKDKEYLSKNINGIYYYSQPLYITKTCLKCHGKKDKAPEIIKQNYDKAYDYKLGEIRGIIDIEVSHTLLSVAL